MENNFSTEASCARLYFSTNVHEPGGEGERESSFANCVDMSNCGVDTYGCVTPLVGPATDPTMRREKQSPVTRAALWQAPVHATTICIPITCAAALCRTEKAGQFFFSF